jgi:hypothetical protein
MCVSDLVLLNDLPPAVAKSVSAYVGCIAGASLMHDYVRLALEAGLTSLSIPEIVSGSTLADVVAPSGGGCCSAQAIDAKTIAIAAAAVASIKLHGRKPAE